MKHKKGFTLMEFIFVVIIVAVLSTIAVQTYAKVRERAKMSDAANMMTMGANAQERYFLKRNAYTNKWSYLDVGVENKEGLFKNEDTSEVYYTNGTGPDNTGDGFAVDFEFDYYRRGFVVAQRVGSETYTYKLVRPFGQGQLYCIPVSENEEDVNFCMDYAGVDVMTELPPNPMVPVPQKIQLDTK